MTCNVKQNTISHIKDKGLVDDNMNVVNALFFPENARLSNLAREKYGVTNPKLLFSTVTKNDKVKAVPNEEMFKELQKKKDEQDNPADIQEGPPTEEKLALLIPAIPTPIYKGVFEGDPMGALKEIYEQATSSPAERTGAVSVVGEEIVALAEEHFSLSDWKVKVKNTPSFSTAEPFRHIIKVINKEVGEVLTVSDGSNLTVQSADVYEGYQGKGIGTAAYQQIGEYAYSQGLSFRSDEFFRLNKASTALWEGLVRIGKAIKGSNRYYYGETVQPNNLPPIIPEC